MATSGYHGSQNQKRLQQDGVEVCATIDLIKSQPKDSTNAAKGSWYFFDYHFTPQTQNAPIVMKRQEVSKQLYQRHAVGDRLAVQYLPSPQT